MNRGMSRKGTMWIVAAALGFVVSSFATAAEPAEIVERLEKKHNELKTAYVVMETKTSGDGQTVTATNKVWKKKDGKKWKERRTSSAATEAGEGKEKKSAKTDSETVCDGEHCYREMKIGDSVMVFKSKADEEQEYARIHAELKSGTAALKDKEELLEERCAVIEIKTGGKRESQTITYWISEETGLVLKRTETGAGDRKIEVTVTEFELDEEIDDAKFTYKQPEGATVVDTDSLGKAPAKP